MFIDTGRTFEIRRYESKATSKGNDGAHLTLGTLLSGGVLSNQYPGERPGHCSCPAVTVMAGWRLGVLVPLLWLPVCVRDHHNTCRVFTLFLLVPVNHLNTE